MFIFHTRHLVSSIKFFSVCFYSNNRGIFLITASLHIVHPSAISGIKSTRRAHRARLDNRKDAGVNAVVLVMVHRSPSVSRGITRVYEIPLPSPLLFPPWPHRPTSYPRLCFRSTPQIGAHLIEIRIGRVFKIMIRANDALKRIALSHEVHRRW